MYDNNERESNDYRQGYAKGYSWGFWTGSAVACLGTIILLYLIGTYLD